MFYPLIILQLISLLVIIGGVLYVVYIILFPSNDIPDGTVGSLKAYFFDNDEKGRD